MKPEERIDIIDFLKYATRKRFIKSSCDMKMDDPLRKITQRVLSKMFPGAIISKNRNRRAYNIAFTGKQFCGDTNNWIPPDNLEMYPSHVLNHASGLLLFMRHIPECFWPHLIASYESGHWEYGHWRANRDGLSPDYIESVAKSLKADKYLSYTREALEGCMNQLMTFQQLYEIPEDGAKKTIAISDYGFSFYYGPEAYTRYSYRHHYHNENNKEEEKIIRRFNEPSSVLTTLENLSKALKVYKIIKTRHEGTLRFISMFRNSHYHDLSRHVRQIEENRDQFREPEKAIHAAVGKALDERFGTHFYKDPPKEQPVRKPAGRVVEVDGAMYNIDTVQNEFNQWLEDRGQE